MLLSCGLVGGHTCSFTTRVRGLKLCSKPTSRRDDGGELVITAPATICMDTFAYLSTPVVTPGEEAESTHDRTPRSGGRRSASSSDVVDEKEGDIEEDQAHAHAR